MVDEEGHGRRNIGERDRFFLPSDREALNDARQWKGMPLDLEAYLEG
jgi:hypothetical protein